MIELFAISMLAYGILSAYAYFKAKQHKCLHWSNIALPFTIIIFWISLTMLGYGHQSLSHIIEIPIVLLVVVILFNIKVFIIDKYNKKYKRNSYILFILGMIFIFLIRSFMPYIPE